MTWLTPPDPLSLPDLPPLPPVRATAASAHPVPVHDDGEPLVTLPGGLPSMVPYDSLPLPTRGPVRLRRGVVERLERAAAHLPERFGITVLDGWRSPGYQAELLAYYRAQHPELGAGFVADPDDAATVPPHTTGGAVDLTLSLDGVPLALGSDYDAFDESAHLAALEPDGPSPARELRRLLAAVLTAERFAPYPLEWWHWSYGEQWWARAYGEPRTRYGVVED